MTERFGRRELLGAATGALVGTYPARATAKGADVADRREVRLELLRPKAHASAEDGRRITDTIVSRLATFAGKMPTWDYQVLDRFVDAEATLVAGQLEAPRGKKQIWAAWRNIGSAMRDYGKHLADERFDEIKAAVDRL